MSLTILHNKPWATSNLVTVRVHFCSSRSNKEADSTMFSSLLALSKVFGCRNSNRRSSIAAGVCSSLFVRSIFVLLNSVEQRRGFLKASAASLTFPLDCIRLKRGWTVLLPDLAPKTFFTSRSMAQTAGASTSVIVVYITVPNKETATKLSSSLVSNKLAVCVNQVPGVVSTYMWEGKLETDEEILLIVKTRQSLLDALTTHVKANHPYTVPEVIALPIVGGSDTYIKWVADNTLEHQNT